MSGLVGLGAKLGLWFFGFAFVSIATVLWFEGLWFRNGGVLVLLFFEVVGFAVCLRWYVRHAPAGLRFLVRVWTIRRRVAKIR